MHPMLILWRERATVTLTLTHLRMHTTCLFFCLSCFLLLLSFSLSRANVPFSIPLLSLSLISSSFLHTPYFAPQAILSYPMALIPSSSQPHFTQTRLDLDSIRSLVSEVNHHLNHLLSDPTSRNSLQQKSRAILSNCTSQSSEFTDQSVISSLYYGIKSTEAGNQCGSVEEKNSQLVDAEKMLQVPALQEEDGTSTGIENRLLVSLAYFYLALVKKLQGDQWQMTLHFLQSVLVHPELVRTELSRRLWECVFGACVPSAGTKVGEEIDDVARCQARRYKSWLMYYQVVSYGKNPIWNRNCDTGTSNHQ